MKTSWPPIEQMNILTTKQNKCSYLSQVSFFCINEWIYVFLLRWKTCQLLPMVQHMQVIFFFLFHDIRNKKLQGLSTSTHTQKYGLFVLYFHI